MKSFVVFVVDQSKKETKSENASGPAKKNKNPMMFGDRNAIPDSV